MCFIIDKQSRSKRAKSDINCWKELEVNNVPFFKDEYPPYKKNKINPIVKIKKRKDSDETYFIKEGYHSWKTNEIAIDESWRISANIHRFIIPKGTRYFENKEEYVSETIIMKD